MPCPNISPGQSANSNFNNLILQEHYIQHVPRINIHYAKAHSENNVNLDGGTCRYMYIPTYINISTPLLSPSNKAEYPETQLNCVSKQPPIPVTQRCTCTLENERANTRTYLTHFLPRVLLKRLLTHAGLVVEELDLDERSII
ncbi:uncharacterized protein H6S33_008334 [Morchella sextelata]|uniref:uncharacterized protein n=1 Tax=Morchella sextelata TaxID=1174677 RepID=UPI001D037158|nr:uncharacterized protein H6S33_008334 [Morchella sextelata]KAH0602684.1 hypothetical protein H6S33_008334 [Morchella sextelata]